MSDSGVKTSVFLVKKPVVGQKPSFYVKNPGFRSKPQFLGQKGSFEVMFGSKKLILGHSFSWHLWITTLYFGGFNCIVDLEEENQLCHHSAVTPYKTKMVNGFEYPTCRCYPGYKLCEDQWTCTCMCKTCGRKRRSLNVITSKYGFKKHNPADRFSLNEPFKKINRKKVREWI